MADAKQVVGQVTPHIVIGQEDVHDGTVVAIGLESVDEPGRWLIYHADAQTALEVAYHIIKSVKGMQQDG